MGLIEEKIDLLKKRLVEYGSLVVGMVEKSIRGLVEKDMNLINDVLENDEPRANDFEIEIDEMCVTLIIKYQPIAIDIRTIIMLLKMSNDLERIGDHAVNICQNILSIIEKPPVKPLIDIPRMAEEVMQMLYDGVNSFVDKDPVLAEKVCEQDRVVDALRDQIVRKLITYMASDASTIERSLHLMNISKNLERIADLSTNICEEVIYLVEGRIIKHHHQGKKDSIN